MFDHEKLDAYRLAIARSAWVSPILDEVQPRGRRPNVLKHLEESATSIAINIAEGKATLVRVVSTITTLIERHLHDASTSTSTSTSTSAAENCRTRD